MREEKDGMSLLIFMKASCLLDEADVDLGAMRVPRVFPVSHHYIAGRVLSCYCPFCYQFYSRYAKMLSIFFGKCGPLVYCTISFNLAGLVTRDRPAKILVSAPKVAVTCPNFFGS